MTIRARCLTLAALSVIASLSIFVSASLVFSVIADEVETSLLLSLFLPSAIASPFVLIAVRFLRRAQTAARTQMAANDLCIATRASS